MIFPRKVTFLELFRAYCGFSYLLNILVDFLGFLLFFLVFRRFFRQDSGSNIIIVCPA